MEVKLYMILWWKDCSNYLSYVANKNDSIRLFGFKEANEFIDKNKYKYDMKIISTDEAI